LNIKSLSGEQRRQLIDTQQIWGVWRALSADKKRRFVGGMRWARRGSGEYLLRKIGASEKSLGIRSSETEAVYEAFMTGRKDNKDQLTDISRRLDEMAPVNRAMGLGRMPAIAARIARRCDERELLGEQLFIVGTNALFAYESLAGVQFDSGLLATGDIDLVFDARRRMSLATQKNIEARGLIGILQKADKSFKAVHSRSYQAANKNGYLVDLICPQEKDMARPQRKRALSESADDLEGAEVLGLDWLVNAPKIETVVIDEMGYPAPVVATDPRVYALHKFWLSGRPDRSSLKAKRDLVQARAVAHVAANYLQLDFKAADLSALPEAIRHLPAGLLEQNMHRDRQEPGW
jgi:hypothetical protein